MTTFFDPGALRGILALPLKTGPLAGESCLMSNQVNSTRELPRILSENLDDLLR
jgi:hypothetical protein